MTEYCEVHCEILHTTDDAVLVNDGIREQWIPLSCIAADEVAEIDASTGKSIDLSVAYWFAKKEGMI